MDTPYRPPNILRLFGITLNDLVPIENVADNRLLDAVQDRNDPSVAPSEADSIYPPDKIPRAFTGLANWPDRTNLRCWQCDFAFDDRPKFVPTYVRESENGGIEFGVLGNMCTFNCAELWININYAGKDDQRWRAQDNLCLVYFLFTGRRISRIRPAPNKTELKQYGGDLDEDAFWKKMRELDLISGLRDHTPGSVIPERDRAQIVPEKDRIASALATLNVRANLGGAPSLRSGNGGGVSFSVEKKSIWGACGLQSIVDDSVDIPNSVQQPRENNVAGDIDLEEIVLELPPAAAAVAANDDAAAAHDSDSEPEGPPIPQIESVINLDEILGLSSEKNGTGETLPADSETLPADSETLLADIETLPADSETLPADNALSNEDIDDLFADLGVA